MNESVIELHDVTFAYESGPSVLAHCDFRLDHGQRLALRGSNGSGKTTLLHLIVGLLRPKSGRVEVFGLPRAVESDFHDVRQRVGLLFQEADDQLFCPTVAEDVAFGPLNLGVPRDRVRQVVAETLESVGLSGYEHRITYKLSSGEKRLAALATVLAMQPEVLLLDEPTTGLDEQATERLTELLVRLPQTMLIVSHQSDFCRRVTDGTAELREGSLMCSISEVGRTDLPRI
jgi:cobalt/nickel transport system ATP-binding protein